MDLAGFDLNLLRVFDAVFRERSVTRAGDQIGLSQPAVSAALNRLRYLLDDQLFVRRGTEMIPTPRAEDLSGPINTALEMLEAAVQGRGHFDPTEARRTYTLLAGDYFSMLLMPSLSERVLKIAPGVRLRLLDGGWSDAERMLQDDAVDLVLEGPIQAPEWVSRETLFRSKFVIVAPAHNSRLADEGVRPGDTFPLELFCELPHALRTLQGGMTSFTDAALEKIGRSRRVVLAVPHFQGVLLAVARGGMIAAVPETFAEQFARPLGLALYPPPVEMPTPEIQMYWHSRHDRNPAHCWLRTQVAETVKDIVDGDQR